VNSMNALPQRGVGAMDRVCHRAAAVRAYGEGVGVHGCGGAVLGARQVRRRRVLAL